MFSIRYNFLKAVMFITAFTLLNAQSDFLGHAVHFTSKDRPNRGLEESEYRLALTKKYDPLFDNKEYLDEFIGDLVKGKISYLNSNHEYENLNTANLYIQKIAERLGFDKVLNRPIEVKIVRDPTFNAYVYEDGVIYIHIGMLANMESEAEIAAILSHEVGHIVNQHVYKRFLLEKKYIRNQEKVNAFSSGLMNSVASGVNKQNYSNYLVQQEEEADLNAFKAVKLSEYDYSSFNSIYSKFIGIESKYKNTLSYNSPWFYFKTHPNSESRINAAKAFAAESRGKKKFLIDSLFFFKIKNQAIDETINLYFEHLEFNACLEMSFRQHLFYPEDPFYLFYITECTRRLIASNPFYEEALFISGVYNPSFCKNEAGLNPTCVITEGEVKPKDKRVNNSIFNKLSGVLVSLSDAECKTIVNRRLVQKDTIPFLTYSDAYSYFTSLNKKLGYASNNYSNSRKDFDPAAIKMLEKNPDKKTFYAQLPTIVNEYVTSNTGSEKILWILYNFGYVAETEGAFFEYHLSLNENESYDKLINYYKSAHVELDNRTDLNFDEYNKVLHYFYTVSDKLSTRIPLNAAKRKTEIDYKISEVMPELYSLLYNHNYKAVVFSSVNIDVQTKLAMGKSYNTETWSINNFWLDAKTNKIKRYADYIYETPSYGLSSSSKKPRDLEKLYFQSVFDSVTQTGK